MKDLGEYEAYCRRWEGEFFARKIGFVEGVIDHFRITTGTT